MFIRHKIFLLFFIKLILKKFEVKSHFSLSANLIIFIFYFILLNYLKLKYIYIYII
jgi:hypothetical protein